MAWYQKDRAETERLLESSSKGLSKKEAAKRLCEYGPNALAEAEKKSALRIFLEQFADLMVLILIVAALVSAFTGDVESMLVIVSVLVLNAVLGTIQHVKAEKSLESLKSLSSPKAKVIRGGVKMEIDSVQLVPGDMVSYEAGDMVVADGRILENFSLQVNESSLTGESANVDKSDAVIKEELALADRINMVYSGSLVTYGRANVMVTATGMETEIGKIAGLMNDTKEKKTPLQATLDDFSGKLAVAIMVISILVFGLCMWRGMTLMNSLLFAVALAVAAVPEALSSIVTIVQAMGTQKMAKEQAIIKNLAAVESLGCVSVICSDKTGTLTQNKMTVVRHETENLDAHVRTMALCSDATWDDIEQVAKGEPTEAALVADAAKLGYTTSDLASSRPRIGEAPFDSSRKMMSVVVRTRSGKVVQHTKGAPDEVLARCTKIMTSDGIIDLTDEARSEILAQNKSMADQALRVMASARRDWGTEAPQSYDPANLEHDMIFVGLSGMIDPVRPEVKGAVAEAHEAGMRTVMITGDHIDTAVAIAIELGIITDRSQAITGAQLDKISDEEFEQRIETIGVYARVQPEHKVRIVDTWRKKGMVTAMTGDGVNDAPSIKRADIGIGMGITGTDVTKGVADMVLADDNFATIISACEEGRRIYDNIRKCIQFLLSSNLAEVISVFIASLVGFTILQPTHLLWINLITDSLPALAMATEKAEPGIMKRKPRNPKDGIFAGGVGFDCLVQGSIIALLTLVSYFIGHYFEYGTFDISQVIANPEAGVEGMTMAFLTLSMVEMFHSFNMRSLRGSIFKLTSQNIWLWGSFVMSLILTFVVIETPLSQAFGFAEIGLEEYATAMLLAASIIPLMELYKAVIRSVQKNKA